jgi:hypothetical protein
LGGADGDGVAITGQRSERAAARLHAIRRSARTPASTLARR